MGYSAQLVVRSRDPHGTDIIEEVKRLASEQDKTYSEMALALLDEVINQAPAAVEKPQEDGDPSSEPAAESPAAADAPVGDTPDTTADSADAGSDDHADPDPTAGRPEQPDDQDDPSDAADSNPPANDDASSAASSTSAHPKDTHPKDTSPDPASSVDPDSLNFDTVDDVIQTCIDHLEAQGAQAAANTLAIFFTDAGPVEGGQVKNKLKSTLTDAEYDVILDKLRQTNEYRNYRQRVIFDR